MVQPAIETIALRRSFRIGNRRDAREFVALDDVNLRVEPGELFGLLGPNGAGKTTLIKILATLLLPTSGRAFVDGLDVTREVERLRPRINMVSGGENAGYGMLTVRETLWMFGQFYGMRTSDVRRISDRLLAAVGLADKADEKVYRLSTGMRQKMNLCRGLVTEPRVLFLDEPTIGLDVSAAHDVRRLVREWLAEHPGHTILLTTHYLQEADDLCDRIAIIDRGRIIACDTPEQLKRLVQHDVVFELVTGYVPDANALLAAVPGVIGVRAEPVGSGTRIDLRLAEERAVADVIRRLTDAGYPLLELEKRTPSLEEAFVKLVGRGIEDE